MNQRNVSPSPPSPLVQDATQTQSNPIARHYHKGVTYSPIRQERNLNGSTRKDALAGSSTVSEPAGFSLGKSIDKSENDINGKSAEGPRPRGIAQQLLLRRASTGPASGTQDHPTELINFESHNTQSTPSVQFSHSAVDTGQSGTSGRAGSEVVASDETVNKSRRGGALFNKLKAFASPPSVPSHKRSSSGFSLGRDSVNERRVSHLSEGDEPMNVTSGEGESDIDADAEDSTGEDDAIDSSDRRKRKSRRPQDGGPQTAPTTPKSMPRNMRPGFFSSSSMTPTDKFRPSFLPRRATMTDLPAEGRQGVSEDEGRDKIRRANAWRRGSAWVHGPRGLSYASSRKQSQQHPTDERRPSNLRRLTGFGASNDGTESSPFSPWRGHRGERATTISAAKWRQLKAGLRMMGQRRKAENTIDHAKSAELLAELTAGVPAALIVASMFQRDEHGNKRIPILLEQLKVRLTDSRQVSSKSGERHMIFRIELEYGNGLTRMKWVIHRALRDFVTLHTRYKIQISAQKYVKLQNADARTKLPRFPRSAFPYLRDARGLKNDSEDEEDGEGTGLSGGEASGAERTSKKKARPTLGISRRKSSLANIHGGDGSSAPARKDAYPERQRKKLELYLQQMIRYLIFRPESNRLCKFLELSALGVRLAAEGSYHGKEGLLIIQSGKGVDFRKAWTPSLLAGRHGPKWFSVRHSYVVCVDSPEEMNIYDVFLVDSSFRVQAKRRSLREHKPKDMAKAAKESASHPKHHSLKLYNSERKMRLLAKTERQLHQFEESIKWMLTTTSWAKPKRFDSFAPVRSNVFAQWLVDGRDYMWNVSRAISMAKDVIYIHDWWLTPELYMRRPAAISQKWRLDRLLQRKAREGVKVFVIMYRNINSAIPIDSEYTKFSLLDLHHNVFVQRSPNQFRQNTFFWAHHEKICIVDHMVAFVGGIDLCFGRWDTPQHSVVDDKLTGFEASDAPKDADHCQLWPGKDYSNPRVQDFYALEKPYEEMYDRAKVPRMPWHDIHMQIVGQPARDLTRHFVQRWNYILRQRKPTRPTPFLLPPPDFQPADLESLGLNGTCEVQILRSACWWSLGTPNTEHSIMNAYVKTIEQSEHFVYIENQFFISSCEVEGTRVENHIGDALVERIVRASQQREDWRAVIVIPLMPGFQNTVDQQEGTSVRLIMQCQYRSICRGEASIFGRVRAQGIEPEDYIQFYSLRSWGRIGPTKQLVTEQLYIHAKCMVVDDRIAIIGSANINERSMLGSRDSECAAVVRDTDMLWSTMSGEPYLVGRFAHTLRVRLMREHLGIDVDEVLEDELQEEREQKEQQWENDMNKFHDMEAMDPVTANLLLESKHRAQDEAIQKAERVSSFNYDAPVEQANNPNLKSNRKLTVDPRVTDNVEHKKDVDGEGTDAWKREEELGKAGRRDTYLVIEKTGGKEVLLLPEDANAAKGRPLTPDKQASPRKRSDTSVTTKDSNGNAALPPSSSTQTSTTALGLSQTSTLPPLPMTDDTDIGGPSIQRTPSQKAAEITNPLVADMKRPFVDKDCMRDPLNDSFFIDTWHAVAENNTKLFRQVFRCMPDNDVKSWKEYKEYSAYAERFSQAQGGGKSKDRVQQDAPGSSGPPGNSTLSDKLRLLGPIGERAGETESKAETFGEKLMQSLGQKDSQKNNNYKNHSMGKIEDWAEEANRAQFARQVAEAKGKRARSVSAADTDTTVDEKAPLRTSNELKAATTFNSEATTKVPPPPPTSVAYSDALNRNTSAQKRRRRATTRSSRREFHASDDIIAPSDANELMQMVQGHLVLWPYDWLAREEQGGNWLYSIDGLAPLEI